MKKKQIRHQITGKSTKKAFTSRSLAESSSELDSIKKLSAGNEYEKNKIFLLIIGLIILYVFLLGISQLFPDKTGSSVRKTDGLLSNEVYQFLTNVADNPKLYTVVIGSYAKDYELGYAKKIASIFGVKIKDESYVSAKDNLILVGNPNTNIMLDKFLVNSYSDSDTVLSINNKNLMVVVSDENQAKKASDMIASFSIQKYSPDAEEESSSMFFYLIPIIVIIGLLVFLFVHHKIFIQNSNRIAEERKLTNLSNYIKSYSEKGYDMNYIKKWLMDYGFEEKLVTKAMEQAKNA